MDGPITVYRARTVQTMDPSLPTASAVAVSDGRIVEVGSLESLRPWLDHHDHVLDDAFADAVVMPGFIDPHVHPTMMAVLMACQWLTPEPWQLPGREVPATEGDAAFFDRLCALDADTDSSEPLVVFGYHAQYHGPLSRADLDEIDLRRPIVVWQRSFHELWANTAGLHWLEAAEGAEWDPQIDLEAGRLFESGMIWGLRVLGPHLMGEGRLEENLNAFRSLVHQGGVTTIADAGVGIFDLDAEIEVLFGVLDADDTPFRTHLMPNIPAARGRFKDELFERLDELFHFSRDRVSWLRAAKFLADGAFIAQLMQVGFPGYIDGHQGAWLAEPQRLRKQVEPFWHQGWDINIHVNGDAGVDACLDTIDALLHHRPRFDHRTVLHHFGVSTQAQSRRLAALGCAVQANGYYLHQFGDRFGDEWLGHERASQMTRLGSARRHGVSVALHSDVPMGPVQPLLAASSMATRTTRDGAVLAPAEALSVPDALAAITIEAAYQLRLDHEVGSLASGKRADFVVLDADPFDTDPASWPDIGVVATVVGGEVFWPDG